MHWYGGSIAEAVNLSKQKNAIFVVFVEGENELSAEMATTIDDSAVVSRLANQTNFLAIKLRSGSPNYMHFAQIYQFVPVPSLFFIGRNGTPLEVVCAGVQPDNLATRIDRILEEHRKEKPSPIQPSTSSQSLKEQTINLLQSEMQANSVQEGAKRENTQAGPGEGSSSEPVAKIQKREESSGGECEVVCDGDVCVRRPKAKNEAGPSQENTPATDMEQVDKLNPSQQLAEKSPSASESAESIEEKLEKAKELIEARRREKAEKERELAKQKELERRAQGQGVAELKRWQADQELRQIQEERKREKMENNLARQRILEQIAQDRAERRARDAPPPPTAPSAPEVPATSGDGGERARLHFKLPDGSSHVASFSARDTVDDVHRYLEDNLQLSRSSFSLWLAFPRRELSGGPPPGVGGRGAPVGGHGVGATLRSLQLAPSAALLVLARREAAVQPQPTAVASFITFFSHLFTTLILEPSQNLFAWVRSLLFPGAAPARGSPSPSPAPNARGAAPRTPSPTPTNLRRRANIHRLGGDGNSDDDNNTWNGNSTQQM